MTTKKETKLKSLFNLVQHSNVVTSSLLKTAGISNDLRRYYVNSGWLESVGSGAYKKPNDNIEWQGAINAIQKQTEINVHVGGLSALSLQGYAHYFRLNNETLYLFSEQKTKLPKWFTDYDWGVELFHKPSSFLPKNMGVKELMIKEIPVLVSTPERAMLECLYLAPQKLDLVESYQIFEGLVNLKPKLIMELLQNCNSIKVKRLFLYMAEKTNHQWFNFIQKDKIELGSGDRMITKNGAYNAKYKITVPKELSEL